MELENVMITQAGSKLGLEFVSQLISLPNPPKNVFAIYEDDDSFEDLQNLQHYSKESCLVLIKIDINHPDELDFAKAKVEEFVKNRGLDLLVNVTCFPKQERNAITDENLEYHFENITLTPLSVFQIMLPVLEKAARRDPSLESKSLFLNITEDNTSDTTSYPVYEISKVAFNMALEELACKVRKKNVFSSSLCLDLKRDDDDDDDEHSDIEISVALVLLSVLDPENSSVPWNL